MEHQYLEDDYLYEDEDALSQLRELRSKINYAKENGEIEKALFLYFRTIINHLQLENLTGLIILNAFFYVNVTKKEK